MTFVKIQQVIFVDKRGEIFTDLNMRIIILSDPIITDFSKNSP